MNGDPSIAQSRYYLQQLEQLKDEIDYAYEQFNIRLEKYTDEANFYTKTDLQNSIAYFEKYVLPFIITRTGFEDQPIHDSRVLSLGIDGYWRAFEFNHFFDSLDYLSKVFTLDNKMNRNVPDVRLRRGMTRSPVYRYGRLYYYLSPREELRVRQIEFASPGLVSFEGIGEIIKELRETVDYLITGQWVKGFVDTFYNLRDKEGRVLRQQAQKEEELTRIASARAERMEARLREIAARSLIKKTIRQMREQPAMSNVEALGIRKFDRLADTAVKLEANGLARLGVVEDGIIDSASKIHRLGYERGKIKKLPEETQ
ncbi:hypothetical protein [Candidatus Leptofilum sp.]|uniref:hypothetical protein n=1 Tax=Candidatus Leptofilum sp. TaxID=3241576 RepID=UPI003B5C60D2